LGTRIPAGLTPEETKAGAARDGRKFGLVVGAAFIALAAFAYWRASHRTAAAFGVIGGALVLAALSIPDKLGPVERAWMALAQALSKITTPIFMAVLYFVVLTPFALSRRLLGKNALVRPAVGGSYWMPRAPGARRGDLERQF
jgi:hypothetical protein